MKHLAKHFGAELTAAGQNDGVAWTPDGTILGWDDLPLERQAAIQAVIDAHDPDTPPPQVITISKADLWRALTEQEAEAVDAVLTNPQLTSVRLRRIFEAAQFISTADPDYPALKAGLVAAIGEARADEVLPQS